MRAAVERARGEGREGGARRIPDDPLARQLRMMSARAGASFSEFDGNLTALSGTDWLRVPDPVSPTRLESYGVCGFRFFMSSVLGLRVPDEPRDPETIDPLVRGTIVHGALEDFFRQMQAGGRPAIGESWRPADAEHLLRLLEDRLAAARRRGVGGMAVFARQQERALRADLIDFLDADSRFRAQTGAVPCEFEKRIEVTGPDGQRFVGYVDRIDRDAEGRVWVVDYKTGRAPDGAGAAALGGGTRLQLPVYLLATGTAHEATALYWYITARGGFAQVGYTATAIAQETFARTIAAIRGGVAAGSFPAVPGDFNEFFSEFENCNRCDFTRICARTRGEDFARKGSDERVVPWAGVATAAAGPTP